MSDPSIEKAIVLAKNSDSSQSEVKSIAEVKHGTVHFLTHFSPLQMNTNLHIPPSNWLRSSSKLEQCVKELTWHSTRRPSEFSSIDMAHNSPDLTGEVDVITNAENIKKLLKMPFEKSHISMMVHRIGKSLLLDEFDIHKHLLRQEQADWRWLRQFYYETVLRDLEEKMKCVPRQRKTRNHLRNMNMYSKFLYHSLGYNPEEIHAEDINTNCSARPLAQAVDQTLLPDPLPQPVGMQNHREVLWTFEDIKMLIGTDLPIFCDESYYVSLRLRDMRTPINVLTGLDYWLDNLMCNVPEVAMCFHINGIVKKYEVIKTEDIPNIENSQFDPRVVTDIAKNILSFLKTNATKEGHTYWLYKGSDDDVVKLYDLTALCDSTTATGENPFMVPISMLLYRVARNMWTNFRHRKAPVIRTLLENCLFLLDQDKHSQVYTSANYLLSDLFVPDSSLNDDWSPADSGESSDEDTNQDEESDTVSNITSVTMQTLCSRSRQNRCKDIVQLKPIKETVEERCLEALKFIYSGLHCLEQDFLKISQQSNSVVEEQASCNKDQAIPLHYKPLIKKENSEQLQMTSLVSGESSDGWHHLSKGLLFRKAALAFIALCKLNMSKSQYVAALRFVRAALYCYEGLCQVLPSKVEENTEILSTLLSLAGDIRLVVGKTPDLTLDWSTELKNSSPEEMYIVENAEKEIGDFGFDWLLEIPDTPCDNLQCSVRCYSEALKVLSDTKGDNYTALSKRLGNAYNELGVCQMQKAHELSQNEETEDEPSQQIQSLWNSSRSNLEEGLKTFEAIRDTANQILLLCNQGRLNRLCAQTYTQISLRGPTKEFGATERQYFNKAIDNYTTALLLGKHDNLKPLHESVIWELSTTYFNFGTLLQDYAPLTTHTQEEVEKDVIDLMNKSLKYCKGDTSCFRQPMYQYRAATINHRLASLFHNSFRSQISDQKKRHLRQLADSYYDKAVQQYQQMDCAAEGLRVQLERLALLEFTLTGQSNPRSRLRLLLQMLHLISDCQSLVKSMIKLLSDPEEENKFEEEGVKIMSIMESRLQYILLQTVKAYSASNLKKQKTDSSVLTDLKSLYAAILKQTSAKIQPSSLLGQFTFLQSFLAQVSNFYQQHKSLEQELHLATSS